MAYPKYQGYQYETSPRKLQPEFEPKRNPYQKKKSSVKKQSNQNKQNRQKSEIKPKQKAIIGVAIGFAVLFAISYQNSLITETFNKREELKSNLGAIEKENEQLKINIEKTLNLNNVEQSAKEMLGMQKLSNSQKVYISLPKKDYIESANKEKIVEENSNIIEKIINIFKR